MIATDAVNIGRKFLKEIDEYLSENWQSIRCADINTIYFQFFRDLKEFKGNSNGFTGLSEYLLFRFLYHLLGGSFDRKKVPDSSELWLFVSKSDKNLCIGQNSRLSLHGRRYYPDIAIYHSDRLISVVQIKIYLTRGINEIEKEIETLKDLRSHYSGMQALLIIFLRLSRKGKLLASLEKIKNDNEWFDFLILEQNNEFLGKVLQKWLGLETINNL